MIFRATMPTVFSRPLTGCWVLKPGDLFCCDKKQVSNVKLFAEPVDSEAISAANDAPPLPLSLGFEFLYPAWGFAGRPG